jgi:hypothetical protein
MDAPANPPGKPEMPPDTMVPGEIMLAVGSCRATIAHAFARRIRAGSQVLSAEQGAGLAHAIGQLLDALDEKTRRLAGLVEAADDAAALLMQQEQHAAALARAVTRARKQLEAARGDEL